MDVELVTVSLMSVIVGIFLSQSYMSVNLAEEVFSKDHSLSVLKSSSVIKVRDSHGYNIGYINLGESAKLTSLKTYNSKCILISSETVTTSEHLTHTVSAGSWFGGPQCYTARWPLEKHNIPYQKYVSDDMMAKPDKLGSILERYWISSTRLAVYVPSSNEDFYYGLLGEDIMLGSASLLEYVICSSGSTPTDTHLYMIDNFLHKPSALPDENMIRHPIWSSWARYKIYINESVILNFAEEIKEHRFSSSQLEIDDTYTTNYGDHRFDPKRFPNPKAMISKLKKSGYRVTSWVHPFANYDSNAFQEGVKNGYFIKVRKHDVPGLVKWWQGTGAIINFTNPDAVKWFTSKLENLKKTGIDSFKFDAGESCYMPDDMDANPNLITQQYVETVSKFGGMIETRAAFRNQHLPIFVRMMDKHSYWGFDSGLKSMIPSALHLSIIGYNFVLPDMIGGNAMGPDEDWYAGEIPDKELYIRWFQLAAFLQSMQISISPWQYDTETINIALAMAKIHEEYVAPKIISLAKELVQSGAPILRPVWWISSDDPMSYQIEDQFLIGDEVMVAPVVEREAKTRSIYIPAGSWKDMNNKRILTGPDWISYPVTIRTVPYFERRK